MWSNGMPPPLPPEANKFLKSTFKLCSLNYKTLTINAVKWNSSAPRLVASLMPLEAKSVWKSTFKFCSLYYRNLTINAVKWSPSPTI